MCGGQQSDVVAKHKCAWMMNVRSDAMALDARGGFGLNQRNVEGGLLRDDVSVRVGNGKFDILFACTCDKWCCAVP